MDIFKLPEDKLFEAFCQVQKNRDHYLSVAASVCNHDNADVVAEHINELIGEEYGQEDSPYKTADIAIGLILLVDAILAQAVLKNSPEVPDGQNNTQGESKTYAN